MPSALLWAYSAEKLFIISRLSRSAERSKRIFTGGVVEGNGSYRACFLRKQPRGGHPLSLLTTFAASSPKGTPLRYAGNFPATAKSRPLGEGGLTRSGKTEGVPARGSLSEGAGKPAGFD